MGKKCISMTLALKENKIVKNCRLIFNLIKELFLNLGYFYLSLRYLRMALSNKSFRILECAKYLHVSSNLICIITLWNVSWSIKL